MHLVGLLIISFARAFDPVLITEEHAQYRSALGGETLCRGRVQKMTGSLLPALISDGVPDLGREF